MKTKISAVLLALAFQAIPIILGYQAVTNYHKVYLAMCFLSTYILFWYAIEGCWMSKARKREQALLAEIIRLRGQV